MQGFWEGVLSLCPTKRSAVGFSEQSERTIPQGDYQAVFESFISHDYIGQHSIPVIVPNSRPVDAWLRSVPCQLNSASLFNVQVLLPVTLSCRKQKLEHGHMTAVLGLSPCAQLNHCAAGAQWLKEREAIGSIVRSSQSTSHSMDAPLGKDTIDARCKSTRDDGVTPRTAAQSAVAGIDSLGRAVSRLIGHPAVP
ncbi:hypothetical protein BD289DRAFT_451491 [Coniella lustricola]|uniref:Uncharacterized protein n=1 Tax=Coniella lustricola TaxID=2025994 RepID=A0A2T3AEG3_9PEZI|nr:hypothetical protein BD289DRAFT_451491 [Coniella lustricola]